LTGRHAIEYLARVAREPHARHDGLVVQRLDDELLVYDTENDEAHCLGPAAASQFEAASDGVSRRDVLRRMAIAGAGAALMTTVLAPTAAQAQSPNCGTATCTVGQVCCDATTNLCCTAGECCGFGAGLSFCTAPCDINTCAGGVCT
jgi:hypothetical protein